VALPDVAQLTRELRRLRQLVAHTIYVCSSCDQRRLGEQRCDECNRFGQSLGLGGSCPHCDEPVLLTELLDLEVPSA
jgi:transcription initiation factor IIE alpha subunit